MKKKKLNVEYNKAVQKMIIFDNVTKQHNPRIQVVHKFMITGFPLGQAN